MKLSVDFDYILKRLIVIVLAFLIISQLKSCDVKAATLTPSYWIGYYDQGGTYHNATSGSSREFNSLPSNVRINILGNIGNNSYAYKGNFVMKCDGMFETYSNGFYIRSSSTNNQDVSNKCSYNISVNDCGVNESLGTICSNISYVCSSDSTPFSSDGLFVDIDYAIAGTDVPSNCMIVANTDYFTTQLSANQQQMANDDKNTNSINNNINGVNESVTDVYNITNQISDQLGQIAQNQYSCRDQNISNTIESGYLNSSGQVVSSSNYGITGFIRVYGETSSRIIQPTPDQVYLCLYAANNSFIRCEREDRLHTINFDSVDDDPVVYFVRYSVLKNSSSTRPLVETCEVNRGQGVIEYLDGTLSNASDTTGISGFFGRQIGSNFGLEAVINGPINMIQRATETCTAKTFTIFNQSIRIPCGTELFWERDFTKDFHGNSRSKTPIGNTNTSSLNSIRDTFRTFWCALFGGAILFHLTLKLWKETQKALDPLADSYETISSAIDTSSNTRPEKDLSEITDVDEYLKLKEL